MEEETGRRRSMQRRESGGTRRTRGRVIEAGVDEGGKDVCAGGAVGCLSFMDGPRP